MTSLSIQAGKVESSCNEAQLNQTHGGDKQDSGDAGVGENSERNHPPNSLSEESKSLVKVLKIIISN